MTVVYILENVPLSAYSTMRLGGNALFLTEVSSKQEVVQAIEWAESRQLPAILIGSGSNIVWQDSGYPGLVIVNKLLGISKTGELDNVTYMTAGSGVIWDDFVDHIVQLGLSGIEQLSLIPGTVGATPVQNVGAYGREISDVLTTLEAFDLKTHTFVTIKASECQLGYRTSRFKTVDKGRFFITSVTYFLTNEKPIPPYYNAVEDYFKEHSITDINALELRKAVIAIRKQKLPDPMIHPNNGSFFANPIITSNEFFALRAYFPDIHYWSVDNEHMKLSAAWLIEQVGFKNYHDEETGMAVWPDQSLVLVNEKAESTASLLKFKQKIIDAVKEKFGILLEQEPELLP